MQYMGGDNYRETFHKDLLDANKNIIRIKDYKMIEELKSWEVLCKLNNDSIIYASLLRHTEANMLSKNINDEVYIKNFYLLG